MSPAWSIQGNSCTPCSRFTSLVHVTMESQAYSGRDQNSEITMILALKVHL